MTTGNSYMLKRAMLKDAALANATGAAPVNDEAVAREATDEAAVQADGIRRDNAIKLDEQRFMTNLLSSYDQLSTWSKQNDLATLLAAATIPVQAAASVKQMNSLDKIAAQNQEIIDLNKKMPGLKEAAIAGERQVFQDSQNKLKASAPVADEAYFQPNDAPTLMTNFRRPLR